MTQQVIRNRKLKGIIYCVHLGGIGHIKRMLLLCQELLKFCDIIFIQAGQNVGLTLTHSNFQHITLPSIPQHFQDFKMLSNIFMQRKKILFQCIDFTEKFDFFISEQIPFTKLFWFNEVLSIIHTIKAIHSKAKIFSSHKGSTRNINALLNDKEVKEYLINDALTVKLLNEYYDFVFVHSDPKLINLKDNFFPIEKIQEKIIYTGFISINGKKLPIKERKKDQILISLGAGPKLRYFLKPLLNSILGLNQYKFVLVTGLMIDSESHSLLKEVERNNSNICILSFIEKLDEWLLTCSMAIITAGFTLINTYATSTPTLVIPDEREGSQKYLSHKFAENGFINVLKINDLNKDSLKKMIEKTIHFPPIPKFEIAIDGAQKTATIIANLTNLR